MCQQPPKDRSIDQLCAEVRRLRHLLVKRNERIETLECKTAELGIANSTIDKEIAIVRETLQITIASRDDWERMWESRASLLEHYRDANGQAVEFANGCAKLLKEIKVLCETPIEFLTPAAAHKA